MLPNPGYLDICPTCDGTKLDSNQQDPCPRCKGRGEVYFCQRCRKVQQTHSCGGLAPGFDTHCIRTGPKDTRTGQEIFDTEPEFEFIREILRERTERIRERREALEKK